MLRDLLCKWGAQQPYKGQQRPADSCLPAAKVVGEHADNRRTEEDHAHGQSTHPGWGGEAARRHTLCFHFMIIVK